MGHRGALVCAFTRVSAHELHTQVCPVNPWMSVMVAGFSRHTTQYHRPPLGIK